MNSLIILPRECVDAKRALILDERADYLRERHDLKEGLTVKAGIFSGKIGTATVLSVTKTCFELELDMHTESATRLPISLIVAIPRPQTIKKVVSLASMIGLSSLTFVRSDRSEKNYLQSKSLREEEIFKEVLYGLEQSGATLAPDVRVYKELFSDYFRSRTAPTSQEIFLCADGGAKKRLPTFSDSHISHSSTVLIGPELGWSEKELHVMAERNTTFFSLGERMLRVEIAAAVTVGHLLSVKGLL